MIRDDKFIRDLKKMSWLLDGVIKQTHATLEENREVRKLLNLPKTVHNKKRLTNYLDKASHF